VFAKPRPAPRTARLLRHAALACVLLLGRPAALSAADETVTLNLKDADIASVIGTVAEMTGKNFIIDPRVKGKVTIVSTRPLAADEVYQVFLSVLNVHGFAAIPDKNVIKIVPEVTAKQNTIPNVDDKRPGRGDQYVTRVIQVENVAAAQLVPILRPLLPQEAHLAAYPSSNVLIASATAANLERLVQIIRRIDLSGDSEIEFIQLQHASAEEVVRILSSLIVDAAKAAQSPGETPKLGADLRTNSVLLSGDRGSRLRLRALISHLDTPMERSGNTQVIYLRYAKAKELTPVLTGIAGGMAKKGAGAATDKGSEQLNIQADEAVNAVVISAPPDIMGTLEQVIRRLDIRRAQVIVEAVIAEVTDEKARELGVQWAFDGQANNSPVGVINFAGSGSGLSNLIANPSAVGDGLVAVVGDTATSGGTRIGALLRALSGDVNTNILSTPSLVTLDNEEAEIVVGQNVPFITGSYTSTGTGSSTPTNPFQTISRQDVGLSLKIKPQINEGDTVRLEIAQEVSSISSATTGAADIVTNKRAIKTSVLVDSGQVLVLGGLIDDQQVQNDQKVPGLGDIPILGYLFSYKKTTTVKRNLMVFIHPTILRGERDSLAIVGNKYSYMRDRQLAVRERGVRLMSDDSAPLLPEWNDFLALPPPFAPDAAPPPPEKTDAVEPPV
jgi:general secretion pathway protein D